jgi:hypothetical protein
MEKRYLKRCNVVTAWMLIFNFIWFCEEVVCIFCWTFEGLLQNFYNENQAYNEENVKPKQRFYYSKLTWYNQENCWTNKSFTCLVLRTDDHILEWHSLIPILLFEYFKEKSWLTSLTTSQVGLLIFQLPITEVSSAILICDRPCVTEDR